VQAGPGFADRIERLLAAGLGADSTPAVPRERAALTNAVAIARQYVAEAPDFRETLADTVFRDTLTLSLGGRAVRLRYFGPANTRGDAVVWVPDARVVATGDLVVAPVPFAFNAHVGGWIGALDSVRALGPRAIVPGHGPLMRDDAYVRQMRRMLRAVQSQVSAARATGVSLDSARRLVTLDADRRAIADDDKWLNTLFRSFFLGPAVKSAYDEAGQR
jgi:glyoxylase-like metal-dependent hydrolase (beta-lactamase superfamily II)